MLSVKSFVVDPYCFIFDFQYLLTDLIKIGKLRTPLQRLLNWKRASKGVFWFLDLSTRRSVYGSYSSISPEYVRKESIIHFEDKPFIKITGSLHMFWLILYQSILTFPYGIFTAEIVKKYFLLKTYLKFPL